MKGLQVHAGFLACALKLSICAKGMQDLSRLGLIQYYMLCYVQIMFTITFNCYGTKACINARYGRAIQHLTHIFYPECFDCTRSCLHENLTLAFQHIFIYTFLYVQWGSE